MGGFPQMLDIRALPDSQTQNLRLSNLPKNEHLFIYSTFI